MTTIKVENILENKEEILVQEKVLNYRKIEYNKAETELQGLKDFYELRKQWSNLIKGCIIELLASQILIIILIGRNVLVYNSTVVISIFFAETFAQIIGLAILVVKFLFKENK